MIIFHVPDVFILDGGNDLLMDSIVDVVLNTVGETHLLEVVGNLDQQFLVFDVLKIGHLSRAAKLGNVEDLDSVETN